MVNFKAIFIAAVLCLIMPTQSSSCVDKYNNISSAENWWNLMYPQFSGYETKAGENKVVKIRLVEIFKQATKDS